MSGTITVVEKCYKCKLDREHRLTLSSDNKALKKECSACGTSATSSLEWKTANIEETAPAEKTT